MSKYPISRNALIAVNDLGEGFFISVGHTLPENVGNTDFVSDHLVDRDLGDLTDLKTVDGLDVDAGFYTADVEIIYTTIEASARGGEEYDSRVDITNVKCIYSPNLGVL